MTSFGLTLMVVLMMLGVGLELELADLRAGAARRGAFVGGVLLNVLGLPAAVWAIGQVVAASPEVVAGLLLVAVAPGGPIGAALARSSSADLGFSVALLTSLGALSVVTAPLGVAFGAGGEAADLLAPMLGTLLVCQVAPLLAGMACRRWRPGLATRASGPVRRAASVVLLLVVVGMVWQHLGRLIAAPVGMHAAVVVPMALVLGPVVVGVGPVARGLLLVTAVRNVSVALLLSDRFFPSPDTQTMILVAAWWVLVLPIGAAAWAGRRV